MKEEEINKGVMLKNITSNRVVAKLSTNPNEGIYTFKELPPFVEFDDDKRNSSYKHLGDIKTTRGEKIHKYSVRKKRNKNDKHFTLVWDAFVKNKDIRPIKDKDEYKTVNIHLRLPKSAVKSLRDDFNELLYPTPEKVEHSSDLFVILRQPYALDILKHFSENEEMTVEEFRKITKLGRDKSYKCIESFVRLRLLRSYKSGRSGIKIYRITLEKKVIAKIMDIFRD